MQIPGSMSIVEMKKNKLVVVLGMHRSGTSAITRGLQVMGVELGDRFMPPKEGNNDKGFWEDIDLNALNQEMQTALGSDWHHLAQIESGDVAFLRKNGYLLRAVELLREKAGDAPVFGFKDPRVAKLLPFWQEVFKACQFDVRYVLSLRHPLSVVKSLARRDGFDAEKSYVLWLGHVIASLSGSAGSQRVLVDFDRLMQAPERELNRIAGQLSLPLDPAALHTYQSEFLDEGLRHTVYGPDDLLLDDACPPLVREIYAALLDAASDKTPLDDPALQNRIVDWSSEFERIKSPLALADRLFAQREVANQTVAERDDQIVYLNSVVQDKDVHIGNLDQILAARDGQIADLDRLAQDKDVHIGNLDQILADLDRLAQDKDVQIAGLKRLAQDKDVHIDNLNQLLAERDQVIHNLCTSASWRITRPLREMKAWIKRAVNSKRFDAAWYLQQNPDVVKNGMDPYAHYATFGKAEGRQAAPDTYLQRGIKKARRLRAALLVTVQRRGGIKPAVGEALAVVKREGWEGVRQRLQTLHAQAVSPAGYAAGFDRNDYAEWIRRYDTLTDETRAAMRAHIEGLAHKPVISVVMPTYNPKTEWLIEAIESVRQQIYPHWELCIADDASPDQAVRPILERYAREDERIRILFRSKNGHISAASNSALELATGAWVALLDHDDLLPEHALFRIADVINRQPDARMIYSDEDKMDEAGKRFGPYFKCDWNPDLFYSHNMFSHFGVYSTALLREAGGFRIGFEGAQDYDLALRCTEKIGSHQVVHVPHVLYHWRMHVESTAQSLDAKPYAMLAGERAINEHFQRCGVAAQAELIGYGYRVRYALPEAPPLVSLIIPTRNGLHLIQQCIESVLEKTTYPNYEILIVDNGSDDPATLDYFKGLAAEPKVRVLRDDRPFNYSALNNAAVKSAKGELVALLNNDIEVISPDWLSEMVSHALRPGVGAVGARLWYPNDTLQHGGIVLGLGGVANHAHYKAMRGMLGYFCRASLTQGFSAVTAACLVIRKLIYEKVGGLNETDLHVAFNDVDFCLRVREAGYGNLWTPFAELYHHESATRGTEDTPEKQARFAKEVAYMHRRWGDQLLNDPAYSPNLTLDYQDFSLAWPPRTEFPHSPKGFRDGLKSSASKIA